jgi:hypothetical protein
MQLAGTRDTFHDWGGQPLPSDAPPRHDEARNADTIAALSAETRQPLELVRQIFEEQYARLKATARIPNYVVLFAIRRTTEVLATRS